MQRINRQTLIYVTAAAMAVGAGVAATFVTQIVWAGFAVGGALGAEAFLLSRKRRT